MINRNRLSIYIAVVGSIFLSKLVIGSIVANVAMLKLMHAIVRTGGPVYLDGFPLSDVIHNDPAGPDSVNWFKLASVINPSQSAWWGLGRAGMATGDYSAAAIGMQGFVATGQALPQAEQDAVLALSLDGRFQELTALYERLKPESRSIVFSDTVALAYLEQAKPMIEIGQELVAVPLLAQAARLRPTDLYANFNLYKISIAQHDTTAALVVRQRLMDLRGASVHPTDKRLVNFVVEIVPHLYETGIWNQATVQTVIAYLVWQQTPASGLESLLIQLTKQKPTIPAFWFYLGEFYQRQGKWSLAENAYLHTLAVDAQYMIAKWRLGLVCEKQPGICPTAQALSWFSDYHIERPGDALAFMKIASLCANPDGSPANNNCQEFSRRTVTSTVSSAVTDVRPVVADALKIPAESISFGADFIENGNFSVLPNGQPQGWIISDEIARNLLFRSNAFVGGLDDLDAWTDGGSAVRLVGLRNGMESAPDQSFDWYGIWAWNERSRQIKSVSIKQGQWYLFGTYYRTLGATDVAYMRLNNDVQYQLPATNGEWHRYLGLFCGSQTDFVGPFVFLSTPNSEAWVDDVSVRPVISESPISQTCGTSPLIIQ